MTKSNYLIALIAALASLNVSAQYQTIAAQPGIPQYRDPLKDLPIDRNNETEYQFERSSLRALDVHDPIEGFNRYVYRFNAEFDEHFYLPVVRGYVTVTPRFVRSGVSNFFQNINDVPNLVNSVAQGKVQKSLRTTARLLFNTTLGGLGLVDVAKRMGLPQEPEDFGQTMGFYGAPEGPYLVLPFIGPSSLRDTTGRVVDWTIHSGWDPLYASEYMNENPWTYPLYAIDLRYRTPFRYGALDTPFEYDQIRYLYTKLRELQISQ